MQYQKTLTCHECGVSFIPKESRKYCDECTEILLRDINPYYSVEDEIYKRRFSK